MSTIVGLTGGIGSGKSTVAGMLAELGATVVDADAIVHELQAPGMPMLHELAEAFGPGIIQPDGALDRKALGEIVFGNDEQRLRLNAIVHPAVGKEFQRRVAVAVATEAPVVVLDIPLLYEGRQSGKGTAAVMDFDCVVVVWVPREIQVERTMSRDGCSKEAALARIAAQLPLDEKRALADHVVQNDGARADTEAQVRGLFESLSAANG